MLLVSGCVTVYQPVSGLHSPVVVDPSRPNLRDTRIDLACLPGDALTASEASAMCAQLRRLFEQQGAVVDTDDGPPPPVHLRMEIRSRKLHQSVHPLNWLFTYATLTLVPVVTEHTFAQDVTIRESTGFLLAKASLQGRIVRRFGAGIWLTTKITDLWRPDEEKLGGQAANRDLSRDLYGQLSQMAFNARVHADVLRVAAPAPGPQEGP